MPTSVALAHNIWDRKYYALEMDPISRALHTIDCDHHQIHEGYSFTAMYTRTTANADAHRSGLYIKTPSVGAVGNRCHAVVSFASSAASTLSICEAPTIAANIGTHANAIINRFRDSAVTSGCLDNAAAPAANCFTTLTEVQIAGDGTWATGTVIRTEPLQSGTSPRAAGGSERGAQEYILKANTKYVFLLTNAGAAANTHWIMVDWYEHGTMGH